ncbi:transcriptional regulator [Enterococcus faecalis]|uniref:helix-turn-helix transcriptional regulator n=1 Tax=Enterococcus faecalis TaxID=1351 RepID=UPI00081367B6|nr:helix-turn-helix transcriptional regulator [Enterococcus faecalis]OCK13513.1 transcriptional regulator [Enterococcus faecalis]
MGIAFRDKLKKLRGTKSMTQFAKELGMSKSNYSVIESGKSNPTITTLERIAELTDTELIIDLVSKDSKSKKIGQVELDLGNEE